MLKKKIAAAVVGALSFLYLLNPTLGIAELFPDNLPVVGNLDEGAAGALLIWAISVFRRRQPSSLPAHEHGERS